MTGQAAERRPRAIEAGAVISALAQTSKLIGVPNLVVGFKLKNTDLAKEELIKLEVFATMMLESLEQTKGHFKKTKVGDHEYLVLNLDGGMVPWDQIPLDKFKEMEAEEGDVQKIIDRLKESKLVVALGVRDNYLLLSIGPSLECLEKLGQGQRLIDRAEFKPLEKYVDKRLVSVGYVSQAMNRQVNGQKKNIDDLLAGRQRLARVGRTFRRAEGADPQRRSRRWPRTSRRMMPEAGAVMGLSFLADHGVEGYQYAWGGHGSLDGSQPLGLLAARRRQPDPGRRGTTQAVERQGLRQGREMGQDGLRLFQGVRPAGDAGRRAREAREVPRGGPAAGRAAGQGQPRNAHPRPGRRPSRRW